MFQIGSLSRDLVAKWKDIVTREEEREETEEGGREEGGGGREVNTSKDFRFIQGVRGGSNKGGW